MSAALRTWGLSKRFGDQIAVDSLDLEIAKGQIYGLIGPNGAGKTTTLRMLAGLETPSAGRIELGGLPMTGRSAGERLPHRIGYMPDFFGVYAHMRAWEYLDFFARCYDVPRSRRSGLVEELLELVDLAAKRDEDVDRLSRGMQQRLCLARCLVHDPDLLLLDEPASGLDPRARQEMSALLAALRGMGKTILISSHILSELEGLCDAIGVMERGRLVAGGDLAELEASAGAGRAMRLRIMGGLERAIALLQNLESEGVTLIDEGRSDSDGDGQATNRQAGSAGPETILLRVAGGEALRARILSELIAAGVTVSAFEMQESDLESAFLRLTRGELG